MLDFQQPPGHQTNAELGEHSDIISAYGLDQHHGFRVSIKHRVRGCISDISAIPYSDVATVEYWRMDHGRPEWAQNMDTWHHEVTSRGSETRLLCEWRMGTP